MTVAKKMTITNGANHIDVALPEYGYETHIMRSMDWIQRADGVWVAWNNGATYDRRVCLATITLDSTEALTLLNAIIGTGATNARGLSTITLTMTASSGFYPFGADKGDAGAFTVAIQCEDYGAALWEPYHFFKPRLRIYNVGAYPAYTPPATRAEGPVSMGTVSGLRYPPSGFIARRTSTAEDTHMEGGAVLWQDRGAGADAQECDCTIIADTGNAAALLAYLNGTARANAFDLVSGSDAYPFGRLGGTGGTYSVKCIDETIIVRHTAPREHQIDLTLSYVSGPA